MKARLLLIMVFLLVMLPQVAAHERNVLNLPIEAQTTGVFNLGIIPQNSTLTLNLVAPGSTILYVNVYVSMVGGQEVYSNNDWTGNKTVPIHITNAAAYVLAIYNTQTYLITVSGWFETDVTAITTVTNTITVITTTTTTSTTTTQSQQIAVFDYLGMYLWTILTVTCCALIVATIVTIFVRLFYYEVDSK